MTLLGKTAFLNSIWNCSQVSTVKSPFLISDSLRLHHNMAISERYNTTLLILFLSIFIRYTSSNSLSATRSSPPLVRHRRLWTYVDWELYLGLPITVKRQWSSNLHPFLEYFHLSPHGLSRDQCIHESKFQSSENLSHLELGALGSLQLPADVVGLLKGKVLKSLEISINHVQILA